MAVNHLTWIPLSFIAGVAAASWLTWPVILFLIALVLGGLTGSILTAVYHNQPLSEALPGLTGTLFLLAAILSLCFGLIWTNHHLAAPAVSDEKIEPGETIVATVISEPIVRPNNFQYRLRSDELPMDLLITTTRDSGLPYGSEVHLTGRIERPEPFNGFDYPGFLLKEGISHVSYYPEIELVNTEPAGWFRFLINLKDHSRELLRRSVPYPQYTVVGAMTLGDSQLVPATVSETFSQTGIRHITAISGLHITILITLLMVVLTGLLRMPLHWAAGVLIIILILYVSLVGAPASAVRASIMGGISIMAIVGGRNYLTTRALIVAAVVMLAINPLLLRFDVGFQLSFAAVLGIIFITPFVWQALKHLYWPEWLATSKPASDPLRRLPLHFLNGLYGLVAVTIGAHLSTLPLVIYHFGHLSIVAPLTNLLVMPVVPFLIAASLIFYIFGLLLPALSMILAWPVHLLTDYIVKVSYWSSQLPAAHFYIESIHWLWPVAIYALGTAVVLYLSRTDYGQQVLTKRLI